MTTEQLGLVAEAIAHLETISFNYENARGIQALRRVEPYRQIHHMLRWYLLAWDLDRDDWRVFRLDRMTDLLRTGTPYDPRPSPPSQPRTTSAKESTATSKRSAS